MVLSPFWLSVTLMMHRVKTKIPLKSKHDYRLKWWIPIKIAELLATVNYLVKPIEEGFR